MGRVQLIVDEKAGQRAELVLHIQELARLAAHQGAVLRMAVAGGSVAQLLFPALAQAQLDANQLEIFFCDERAVPLDHPDSNFKLAKELWLDVAGVPLERVHALGAESSLERVADHYERLLRERAERPLDVVVLGMGPDGHIASLFPDHPALESTRWVEVVRDAPKPPPVRLSMTLPLLLTAPHIFLAAFGAEKAPVLVRALDGDARLPVTRLLAGAPSSTLLIDPALAEHLPTVYQASTLLNVKLQA